MASHHHQKSQTSQPSQTAPAPPPTTTATEELTRFATYLDHRTRDFRASITTAIGFPPQPPEPYRASEAEDEGLFADTPEPGATGDWVEVTEDATDVPEVRYSRSPPAADFPFNLQAPETDHSRQDPSAQILPRPKPPPPPGPIQIRGEQAQRAALRALGLTGWWLEEGMRVVAEDVGWLTHTAAFEGAAGKVRESLPVLGRIGQSYGRGARGEREMRREGEGRVREELEGGKGKGKAKSKGMGEASGGGAGAGASMGGYDVDGLEDVPILSDEDDEWSAAYGDDFAMRDE